MILKSIPLLTDIIIIIISGLLLAVASPGMDLWPCAFAAWFLLAMVYERRNLNYTYAAFICGFTWYLISASWVHVPLVIYGDADMWAGAVMVIFTALTGSLICWLPYGYIVQKYGSHITGALTFTALEIFKSRLLFGGLPWLNLAQTQHNNKFALQTVSVTGEHGLTFTVMLAGIYIFYALKNKDKKNIQYAAVLLTYMFGLGGFLYMTAVKTGTTKTVRIVQTGLEQNVKWDTKTYYDTVYSLNEKITEAADMPGNYDIMVLPESTYPLNPFLEPLTYNVIKNASKIPLILGYDRMTGSNLKNAKFYNSMAIVKNGEIEEIYDKIKLAPFGEYFPLEKFLKPLKIYFFGDGPMFTPGTSQSVFTAGDLKIAPMICYEGVFSEIWRQRVINGANVVVLISNDGWFGDSWGRKQHLAIDKIHAAEYGRYLIRVTQDGISGIIDPFGNENLIAEKNFEIADLNFIIKENITHFAVYGYMWYVIFTGVYIVIIIKRKNVRKIV